MTADPKVKMIVDIITNYMDATDFESKSVAEISNDLRKELAAAGALPEILEDKK
jgi:hypothetical protein